MPSRSHVPDFNIESVKNEAFVFLFTEDEFLASNEFYEAVVTNRTFEDFIVGAIIENHAVLIDLNKGEATMLAGFAEDVLHVLGIGVVSTSYKSSAGTESKKQWVDRVVK